MILFCVKSKAAKEVDTAERKKMVELFKNTDLSQYAIRGSEDDWKSALAGGPQGIISIKRLLICLFFVVINNLLMLTVTINRRGRGIVVKNLRQWTQSLLVQVRGTLLLLSLKKVKIEVTLTLSLTVARARNRALASPR